MELLICALAALAAGIGTGMAGLSAATIMVPIMIVLCPSFAGETGAYHATAIALAADILQFLHNLYVGNDLCLFDSLQALILLDFHIVSSCICNLHYFSEKSPDDCDHHSGQQIGYFYFLSPHQIHTHTENQHVANQRQIIQRGSRHERPQKPRQSGNASL